MLWAYEVKGVSHDSYTTLHYTIVDHWIYGRVARTSRKMESDDLEGHLDQNGRRA